MNGTFKCPRCGMVSSHPTDVQQGYCANCHDYTGSTESADSVALRLTLRLARIHIPDWSMAQLLTLARLMADKFPINAMDEVLTAMDTIEREGMTDARDARQDALFRGFLKGKEERKT